MFTKVNDSPLAHLPTRHPCRARQRAWSEGEDGFRLQFPPSWSSECWAAPKNVCWLQSWPHYSQRKPLLSPGVLSTETPLPGFNGKGGERCEGDPLVG